MSCVVGLVDGGVVYMAADSAATGHDSITIRRDPKVWQDGEYVVGFAGSYRVGQVVQHCMDLPEPGENEIDLHGYTVLHTVRAIRTALQEQGVEVTGDHGEDFELLIGIRGRLFTIDGTFQVAESVEAYAAIGSGAPVALGSLYTIDIDVSPPDQLETALSAAESHVPSVRAPFHQVRTA